MGWREFDYTMTFGIGEYNEAKAWEYVKTNITPMRIQGARIEEIDEEYCEGPGVYEYFLTFRINVKESMSYDEMDEDALFWLRKHGFTESAINDGHYQCMG